jgi:glycosyltransferase involved in cell wall biosynthesis
VQESIAEKYGLGREAIPVIYNGVDLGRCLVKESYAQGEHFTVLHIGRFSAEKNHKGLIAAFALLHQNHPEARLRLVGEGDLWEELEQDVAARGLSPFVEFLGRQENVYPYLHEADVLTLTSTVEGIPMTLAEGMGTGLPIVATAVGGVPDMLTNEENALLCEVDEAHLAQCYARYCEDEALRMRHGRAALARSSVFSAEEMAKKYAALYRGETVLGVTE